MTSYLLLSIQCLLILLSLVSSSSLHADTFSYDLPGGTICVTNSYQNSSCRIEEHVEEKYPFYGFATFYNRVGHYIVNLSSIEKLAESRRVALKEGQWLAVVGRFDVFLIKATGLKVILIDSGLNIENPELLASPGTTAVLVKSSSLVEVAPELTQIRYVHLWAPLAALARIVEASLIWINSHFTSNWGWTVIVFGVLLKILLLPVSIVTLNYQREVNQIQAQLAPQLESIKGKLRGEEAHNQVMVVYKAVGVSPFYTLKPMLGMFIQVPVLIAVFNALGEMPQFTGQSFMWINDLAYPDAIGQIDFSIPMLGNTISLLPFVMTVVTVLSTVTFRNRHAQYKEVRRQKRNMYIMTLAFFFLFYPFPAAMLFYWTVANILHAVQQQAIKT